MAMYTEVQMATSMRPPLPRPQTHRDIARPQGGQGQALRGHVNSLPHGHCVLRPESTPVSGRVQPCAAHWGACSWTATPVRLDPARGPLCLLSVAWQAPPPGLTYPGPGHPPALPPHGGQGGFRELGQGPQLPQAALDTVLDLTQWPAGCPLWKPSLSLF